MKKYLLLLIASISIISCKEDSPVFPEGFGPDQPNIATYQPLFNSASWVYVNSTETGNSTQIQYIPGTTINYSGKAFHEAVSTNLGDSTIEKSYFSLKNHIYTLRSESEEFQKGLELEYLNDTAKVNQSWSRDFRFISEENDGFETRIKRTTTTIKAINSTKTVHGKLYKDVIQTQLTVFLSGMDKFEEIASYDFYVAKGVGIIQVDSKNIGNSGNSSKQLKSFSVQ